MNYTTLDDRSLIALIAHAHSDALDELYNRYSRLVFSLALNMLGNRATAEEITLDVFTRIWEKAGTYRPEQAKVSTWLVNIARYRAINRLRQEKIRPEHNSVSWAEVSPNTLPLSHSLEDITEVALKQERVRAAVAQLPPDQRDALALAYFKGYSHRQIAEILEQPLGTVKTRIRLGMQKLRQWLQDEENGTP